MGGPGPSTRIDAPIEQVMYLDKKLTEHSLLQAIARVNRVSKGKSRGYVVDYIGLANHLRRALAIYDGADEDERFDIEESLKNIETEVPILESRYQRLVNLFKEEGVKDIGAFVQQKLTDPKQTYAVLEQSVEALKDIRMRATFEVYLKQFMQSLDIVLPHPLGIPPYWLRQRVNVCSLTPSACTTWATLRPAASIASASRSLFTICSAECLVRFIFQSLPGRAAACRDSHSWWIRFWGAGQQICL